jgi:RNA 2',3'-cyclic 3'-phosphodiesterase
MFDQPSPTRREGRQQGLLTDRLFFAIFPDAGTAARVAQLREALRLELGLQGKPLAIERLHATLLHVGDYDWLPQHVVARAGAVASTVAMPPFTVAFDGAGSFRGRPGHRPFVLRGEDGVAGLMMLQQRLGLAMAKAGLGCFGKLYTPHMTLLYGDRLVAERPVDAVSWAVREFVLVHSLLGRSRYNVLARFPLGAQA